MSSTVAQRIISEEEGSTNYVIQDSRGYDTIAIGCCVDRRVKGTGLCQEAIDAQFKHDSATALATAKLFPFYDEMNDVRQGAIESMAYQLGRKPLDWHDFHAALEAKDYEAAERAGLDTLWAHQTPARAKRELAMLATGKWIDRGKTEPNPEPEPKAIQEPHP